LRYHVRNQAGEELVVPSLADLHDLYVHGFIEDADLVRSESSERWIMAGRMPALAGVRLKRREPGKMLWLVLAVIAFVAIAAGALRHVSPLLLILAVTLVSLSVFGLRRRGR
jgi:hypothetical protein